MGIKALAVCVAIFSSLVATAGARPSSDTRATALSGGTLIVAGDGAASSVLELTRDLSLEIDSHGTSPGDSPIRIRGGGPFTGIVLAPEPWEPSTPPPVVIGRFRTCRVPDCDVPKEIFHVSGSIDGRVEVDKGQYRIYLVGSGLSSVRLEFDEPGKIVRVQPKAPVQLDLQSARSSMEGEGVGAWAGGSVYDTGGVGIGITALWANLGKRSKNVDAGICLYPVIAQAPDDHIFGPQCSAIDRTVGAGTLMINREAERRRFELVATFGYHDQGTSVHATTRRMAAGGWLIADPDLTNGPALRSAGATSLFIELAETWR